MKIPIEKLRKFNHEVTVILNENHDEDTSLLVSYLRNVKDEIDYLIDTYFGG